MIDDYIVFDALCQINSQYKSKYTSLKDLEKEAIKERDFEKLLTIYFIKQTIKTIILYKNFRIESVYKESKRTRYYVEFNDASHLLTITYRTEDEEDIFQIIEKNKEIKQKFRKGMQRMRMYFKKYFNFKLKYIYSKEVTQKGYLHFHLLIQMPGQFRENFKEMIEKLSKWFETEENGVDIKYLKMKDRKKAISYIMKYLTKQNEEMFFEIENSKIYFTTKGKIIRNMEKRIFSYSYARKPRIKRYKPQIFFKTENFEEKRVIIIYQEKRISKVESKLMERILNVFLKYEWKMYDIREAIQKYRKISELIDAERDAVDF